MTRLRRSIAPFAMAWMLCVTAGQVVPPLVYWDTSADALLECTCAHGDHAMCPMHHRPVPGHCQMRGAADPAVNLLAAITIGVSTAPATTSVVVAGHVPTAMPVGDLPPSMRPSPPDPPPPRA
jgi:hypothetical protein